MPLKWKSTLFLLIVLIFYLLCWILHPKPFLPSDPWVYALRAFKVVEGTFLDTFSWRPFSQRVGVVFPCAIFYKLWGVNHYTTYMWPLTAGLIIIVTIYTIMKTHLSKIIALILTCFTVVFFHHTTTLYPDIIVTAFMLLAVKNLYEREEKLRTTKLFPLYYPLLGGIFLFLGFLTKLSVYYVGPIFIITFIKDLYQKKGYLIKKYYLPLLLILIIFFGCYFLVNFKLLGHPFERFKGIERLASLHLWTWQDKGNLVKRITYLPLITLAKYYNVSFVLFFLGCIFLKKESNFWKIYGISELVLLWFGSSSFTKYNPLPLIGRMILPIFPSFIIVGSSFLASLWRGRSFKNKLVIKLLIVGSIILASFPFGGYMLNSLASNPPSRREGIFLVKEIVNENPSLPYLLLTVDDRSAHSLEFYFGFKYPKNLKVKWIQKIKPKEIDEGGRIFIYIDVPLSSFLQNAYGQKYVGEEILRTNFPILYEKRGIVILYPVPRETLKKMLPLN